MFISSLEGQKSIAKQDGGPWPDLLPLDPPLPTLRILRAILASCKPDRDGRVCVGL